MIKYHDNKNGKQYGDDHKLTNNWNPDADYADNEYINVHFRIECPAFSGIYGTFNDEKGRTAFNKEKRKVFESIGWQMNKDDLNGCCMEVFKDKASLYLHPQDFSGNVLKRDVKQIAEALEDNKTFTICWVDLYETVYDISDEEYDEYLNGKRDEVRKLLFDNCKTSRRNQFKYGYEVKRHIATKIQLSRIGYRSVYAPNKGAMGFVGRIIDEMVNEGYLIRVTEDETDYIRTLNKTELKQMKLKEIA